jgi:hypothetical protein
MADNNFTLIACSTGTCTNLIHDNDADNTSTNLGIVLCSVCNRLVMSQIVVPQPITTV